MTGPEHYAEAEASLEMGNHVHVNGGDPGRAALYFAEAQVHATLALAAATAYRATEANAQSPRGAQIAWHDVEAW